MTTDRDPQAPHGRDDEGNPLAPYGLKVDGTPRLSRRGAAPGQQGNGKPTPASKPTITQSKTDRHRAEMLVALADMAVVMPLVGLSASPFLAKRVGAKHAEAFAGDAVIVQQYAPHLAEALVVLSQSKPGALAWLDSVEEKAPYVMLMQVSIQMGKAFLGNHLNPDPRLAEAGRTLAKMRSAQMAKAIEDEAAAMGIPTELDMEMAA